MSLNSLPLEILEMIFEYLSIEDLDSLAQVSTRLRIAHEADKAWYSGLLTKYPRLRQRSCRDELLRKQKRYGGWRKTARARAVAARELVTALDKMADDCHTIPGLPDLAMERLRTLMTRHGSLFIRDALLDVIHPRQGNPDDNLARVHYARMLYREVQRDSVLLPMFRRFVALPPHRTTVKDAAQLFRQWLEPDAARPFKQTPASRYYYQLALLVLTETRTRHPEHPIMTWKGPNRQPLPDSSAAGWTDLEALQLLDVMNDVLYKQLRLMEDEAPQNPEYGCLHRQLMPVHEAMLKSGSDQPASQKRKVILVVYSNLAWMLGISLHTLELSTGLLLRWYGSDGNHWLLLDPCDSGRRFFKTEALQRFQLSEEETDTMPNRRMLQRLIAQAPRLCEIHGAADLSAMRLLSILAASDFKSSEHTTFEILSVRMFWRPMYARRQIEDRINHLANEMVEAERELLTGYLDTLKVMHLRQKQDIERKNAQARSRSRYPPVRPHRFWVGDIVEGPAGWRGVVYGNFSDYHSRACREAKVVVPQLAGSGRIPPIYRLLVDGHRYHDIREDQLKLAEDPRPIEHSELGRYFLRFGGGRYVPVPSLEQRRDASLSAPAGGQEEASNGQETSDAKEQQPREVPDSWVGEWPEIQPDEFAKGLARVAQR